MSPAHTRFFDMKSNYNNYANYSTQLNKTNECLTSALCPLQPLSIHHQLTSDPSSGRSVHSQHDRRTRPQTGPEDPARSTSRCSRQPHKDSLYFNLNKFSSVEPRTLFPRVCVDSQGRVSLWGRCSCTGMGDSN